MKRTDKKLEKLGFSKIEENEFGAIYKRHNEHYDQTVALLHKNSGKHMIQSYDPNLCDTKNIGNTAVGLTYEENRLFLKKMRELGLHRSVK